MAGLSSRLAAVILLGLMASGCAGALEATDTTEVRVRWCPEPMEATVIVDFGQRGEAGVEPTPWPGNYSYAIHTSGAGAGGGGGRSHASREERLDAVRWRLSSTTPLVAAPKSLSYSIRRVDAAGAPAPERTLKGRYTVSPPPALAPGTCAELDLTPIPAGG